MQTQSLLSILVGGIAFETPADRPGRCRRPSRTRSSRCSATAPQAFKPPRARSADLRARLQAVGPRARRRGAPVEFRGIPIGEVDRHPRADRPEDARVLRAGDDPRRPADGSASKVVDAAAADGSRSSHRQTRRHAGGARRARAAAIGQPADRRAVRRARLLPRRAAGDDGLVADARRSCRPFRASSRRSRRASPTSSRSSTSCRSRRSATTSQKALAQLDQTLASARGTLDNADDARPRRQARLAPNSRARAARRTRSRR